MAWRKPKRARIWEGSGSRGDRAFSNRQASAEGLGMLPEQSENAIVLRARESRVHGEGRSGFQASNGPMVQQPRGAYHVTPVRCHCLSSQRRRAGAVYRARSPLDCRVPRRDVASPESARGPRPVQRDDGGVCSRARERIPAVVEKLKAGAYRVPPVRQVYMPKPGQPQKPLQKSHTRIDSCPPAITPIPGMSRSCGVSVGSRVSSDWGIDPLEIRAKKWILPTWAG